MQTRRMIVALVASIAVFYVWMVISSYIWPPPPRPPATTTQPTTSTAPAERPPETTEQPSTATRPAPGAATTPATGAAATGKAIITGGPNRDPVIIGNADKDNPYPMMLQIMPKGATVSTAKIRGHYETVEKKEPYTIIHPVSSGKIEGEQLYSFPTLLRFDDRNLDVPLDDVIWQGGGDRRFSAWTVDIKSPQGEPLARVTKIYQIHPQWPAEQTYDFELQIQIKNLAPGPLRVILIQYGPVGFRKEEQRGEDRKIIGAIRHDNKITAKGHLRSEVFKKNKIALGGDDDSSRIAWAAESNKYFASIMTPGAGPGPNDAPRFAAVEALHLGGTEESSDSELSGLTFQYVTTPRQIAVGGTEVVPFSCYLGPKSKRAFETVTQYQQLDYYWVIREGFYACAPTVLVNLMMYLLNAFHNIPPHNYGVAIIILVLVVRTILHPITKKSQVNMMRMQKQMATLQPKIEAAKQKYANDKIQLNQAIMQIYKEAGVNPAGNLLTCLPMLLQVPIWGALWQALSSTIEMRHAPFDPWWIRDLAGQDAVFTFAQPFNIPLLSFISGPIHSINLLPVLLGISQVLQAKYMPRGNPSAQSSTTPDQLEQQRKMMMFMSGFFVLMLYNAPSGLNLYIMASNFFGILEQWRIRQHLAAEEKKSAGGGGADGGGDGPTVGRGARRSLGKPGDPPKKDSWLQRKWKELEKQADEARRIQSTRDKRGKPR